MRIVSSVVTAAVPILTAVTIVSCGQSTVRGCPVSDLSSSFYGLQYEMVMPSDCPVWLGHVGEEKYTGAYVIDTSRTMRYGEVLVKSSSGTVLTESVATYSDDILDGWSITLETFYPAATDYQGSLPGYGQLYTSDADDYGTFGSGPAFNDWLAHATVQITYKHSSAQISISGPDLPLSNTSGTWVANVSGGTPPYSYAWYRNGQLVSNSSSYSASVGTTQFGLRLEVTDQTWSVASSDYWVDVDGIRESVTGPTVVYSSEGGGTWTASGRGGYTPYTYHWSYESDYGDEFALGSGTSYSGYPAEGEGTLRVTMTDTHGRTDEQSIRVYGIGNPYESGGCEPTPPAITCDP